MDGRLSTPSTPDTILGNWITALRKIDHFLPIEVYAQVELSFSNEIKTII